MNTTFEETKKTFYNPADLTCILPLVGNSLREDPESWFALRPEDVAGESYEAGGARSANADFVNGRGYNQAMRFMNADVRAGYDREWRRLKEIADAPEPPKPPEPAGKEFVPLDPEELAFVEARWSPTQEASSERRLGARIRKGRCGVNRNG